MGKKLETHFDNLDKFYTECEVQEETGSPDKYKEISRVDYPEWVGLTKEEIQKSKYFYKEGLDELGKLDEDLIFGGSKTNYKYDENDGDDMNYDRFIEGLPSLRKRLRTGGDKNGKFIKLHVGICESCMVSAKDMLYKSYTALKLADYLESQGYRVQISTFAEVESLGYYKEEHIEYLLVEVVFKRFEDPLILPTMLTCVSPWFFRYHMFRFWTAKFKCGWGLGHVPRQTRKSTKSDIYISSGECLCEEGAKEKIEEIKKQFENNFNNHKKVEQNAINTEGQAINSRIKENTETIEKIKMEMADIDTKLNETKVKIENIENEEAKNATIDVTAFPKYQEKLKEVNELQEIVDKLINGDTSEIQGRKNNIIDLINNIDKQLNERAIQERTKERIKELENEEENIANKVQELEAQQYQIEQFTKTKVELLESAINSKFEVVKFRLFDTQINGGLVECCDTLVKGVPYSDVNNAHKILAGLDIINTLIKFYQTSAPIFIDNRESINELYNINAQIISLIVTTDSQLRIEVI